MSKGKSINKGKRFLSHYHTSKGITEVGSTSGLRNQLAVFTKFFIYAVKIIFIMLYIFYSILYYILNNISLRRMLFFHN